MNPHRRNQHLDVDETQAIDTAWQLRDYFRSSTSFCRALSCDPRTARNWLSSPTPKAPRKHYRYLTSDLLRLAQVAEEWTNDPLLVGDWMLAPQPALANRSPSQVVREEGADGVDKMLRRFAAIAP